MNWEAIGAVGELVSGLAVLVTLIYLAVQVREARRATIAQIYQARADASSRSSIAHPALHKFSILVDEGNARDEVWKELTIDERAQLRSYFLEQLTRMDSNYTQYKLGFLDESWMDQIEKTLRSTKPVRDLFNFDLEKMVLSQDFKNLITEFDSESETEHGGT